MGCISSEASRPTNQRMQYQNKKEQSYQKQNIYKQTDIRKQQTKRKEEQQKREQQQRREQQKRKIEKTKQPPNNSKIKQQLDWGKDIVITSSQNLIKVELVHQQKFKHLDYKKMLRQCHIYLYQRVMNAQDPIADIKANKFGAGGYTLQFRPGKEVKRQEYDYEFAFQMKNQTNDIIKVKKGTIIIHGDIGHEAQLQFIKNNSDTEISLNKKVDQIKLNGFTINILILGRVGLGKSSYIRNYLKMLSQLYEFQCDRFPQTAQLDHTHTKHFQAYSLSHAIQNNKNRCRINLIDGPGLGGQTGEILSADFSDIYYNALKLLMNGQLDYDKFSIPNQIDIQKAKQDQNQNKIIHYCLIFIKPQDIKELFLVLQRVTTLITQAHITYGLVINRSDEYLQGLPSNQFADKLKLKVRQDGYKVQGFNHIFTTCLSPIYFPENQIFYKQFQTSIYYSLTSAVAQISNNIVNIYLIQNNAQKFVQMLRIKNKISLSSYIADAKHFRNKTLTQIEIKQKGSSDKFTNVSTIINDMDLDQQQKNLLQYKTKIKGRWKIVFKIKPR